MPELFVQISYLNLCCEMAQPPLSTNQTYSKENSLFSHLFQCVSFPEISFQGLAS